MAENNHLEAVFRECIPLLVALGDKTRLKIIGKLYEVSRPTATGFPLGLNVKEITEQTHLSRPAVSHHLKILKDAGFVSVHQRGVCNYYYYTGESCTLKLLKLSEALRIDRSAPETGAAD